jgi:hypothetical protein
MLRYCCDSRQQIDAVSISPLTLRPKIPWALGMHEPLDWALAASIAMIQANILLPLDGKQSGSFAVMDLMRLPLGILTGVGFLGGGAILKKGGSITGLTTAATLWIASAGWRRRMLRLRPGAHV